MSSMDFQPPDTAASQGNADATAARLRDAIDEAFIDYGISQYQYGVDQEHHRRPALGEDATKRHAAALDTLIQYHRSAGAVEALEAVKCTWGTTYGCGSKWMPEHRCDRCVSLQAAQARLAAYEEER